VPADRREDIVRAARALLEEEGPAALTMRRLGERLGIRAPSLYKHVRGKDELEDALQRAGLDELGAAVAREAGAAGDPLAAAFAAYRRFALASPALYRLVTERPLPADHELGPGERRGIEAVVAATGSVDGARAAWAFAHGMVHLELSDRFPPGADVDAAWRAGLEAFRTTADSKPAPTVVPYAVRPAVVRSLRGPD
jgi:AcrR family transcriptional regulator